MRARDCVSCAASVIGAWLRGGCPCIGSRSSHGIESASTTAYVTAAPLARDSRARIFAAARTPTSTSSLRNCLASASAHQDERRAADDQRDAETGGSADTGVAPVEPTRLRHVLAYDDRARNGRHAVVRVVGRGGRDGDCGNGADGGDDLEVLLHDSSLRRGTARLSRT